MMGLKHWPSTFLSSVQPSKEQAARCVEARRAARMNLVSFNIAHTGNIVEAAILPAFYNNLLTDQHVLLDLFLNLQSPKNGKRFRLVLVICEFQSGFLLSFFV